MNRARERERIRQSAGEVQQMAALIEDRDLRYMVESLAALVERLADVSEDQEEGT